MLAAVNVVVGVVVVAVIRSSFNLFVNQVFPIDVSFLLSLSNSTHCAEYLFFPRLSGTRKIQHEGNNINRKFFESNVRHIRLLSKNEMTKIRLKYKWEPMQHSRAWITVHSGWSTREQATEPMARWLRIVGEQVQNILLQILSNILNCCKNFECMIWQLRQSAWGIWTWRIYLSSTS